MKPINLERRLCFVTLLCPGPSPHWPSIPFNLPLTEHGRKVELEEALWPHDSDHLKKILEDFQTQQEIQDMASASQTQQEIQDMASASQIPKPTKQAENIGLDLGLAVTRALFMNRNTIPERSFNAVFAMFKKIIVTSRTLSVIRHSLGEDSNIWKDYVVAFETAIPVIEEDSLLPDDDTSSSNLNRSSSNLMAQNHKTLKKDLEILNDLVIIARNVMVSNEAQDLVGKHGFDRVIMTLIDLCLRVTTRGYDGDAGSRNDTQWAEIVQGYKTLLITSLQFLHNSIKENEKRTLMLWLEFFGHSRTADRNDITSVVEPYSEFGAGVALVETLEEWNQENDISNPEEVVADDPAVINEDEDEERNNKTGTEEVKNVPSKIIKGMYRIVDKTHEKGHQFQIDENLANNTKDLHDLHHGGEIHDPHEGSSTEDHRSYSPIPRTDTHPTKMKLAEMRTMFRTPQSAATILQKAKDHLMARIQEAAEDEESYDQDKVISSENDEDGYVRGSDVAAHRSVAAGDDGDQGDYREHGDQQRGLLADIPLVLGASEIEALPMIIQTGIVDLKKKRAQSTEPQGTEPLGTESHSIDAEDMYSVRCNILLAQQHGRNLLRELLIFIAAWDLQDNHTYFRLMMQIMEAILDYGLMPFAYQAFAEEKDIVSPAQSMIIKLLTQIFRGKQTPPPPEGESSTETPSPRSEDLSRTDTLVVRSIFMTFRQIIIPETCALIFLQGQIRANAASPDDFPLNLWDMERVYEGVYQFLEFFAVLTESEDWKGRLVQWEIVSELVTLLRELDASIPKAPLGSLHSTSANMEATSSAAAGESQSPQTQTIPPVAVERPYDQVALDPTPQPDYADGGASETASATNQAASEFEWRNLKKLVVLVLSSLVWKSTKVQNQIRQYGGVEMILACCNFDANNPYIREHAIMCLRFLLESNKENQDIVRALEPKRVVPDEILDTRAYETYIDDKGKVCLRAKDGTIS